jgi:hypothetical protein
MVIGVGDGNWMTNSSIGSRATTTKRALLDPPTDGDPRGAISLGSHIRYFATHNRRLRT